MTDNRDQSAVRRPVVVAAILFVVATVLLVALRSWLDRPSTDDGIEADALVAAQQEVTATIPETEPVVGQSDEASSAVATAVGQPPSNPSIGTLKVALLPALADDADLAASILADSIRQATLRNLRGMADVEVVDVGPSELAAMVPTSAEPERADFRVLQEINRQYGTNVAAEIEVSVSRDGRCWALGLDTARPGGDDVISRSSRIPRNGDPGPGNDPESIGVRYAEAITVDTRERDATAASRSDARNVLVDATRPDDERISALTAMGGRPLDPESAAAALELATRSASPEKRKAIWRALRSEDNPALAQPMIMVLQSDPDAAVRLEVALELGDYRDEPGVRPALEQAALGDSSADVRLAARMGAMDYEQRGTFRLETLLDSSLTPAERLAPLEMYGNPFIFGPPNVYRMAELRLAYAEIVSGTDDPDLKVSALMTLQQSAQYSGTISRQRLEPDPAVVRALVEAAASADERVQGAALRAMLPIANQPEIRTALEAVLESEPELLRGMDIATALARPEDSNLAPSPPLC